MALLEGGKEWDGHGFDSSSASRMPVGEIGWLSPQPEVPATYTEIVKKFPRLFSQDMLNDFAVGGTALLQLALHLLNTFVLQLQC